MAKGYGINVNFKLDNKNHRIDQAVHTEGKGDVIVGTHKEVRFLEKKMRKNLAGVRSRYPQVLGYKFQEKTY